MTSPDLSFPFGFDARAAWAARSESDRILRRCLALAYSGPTGLYSDDGELQDNRRPWIDYVRDSAADIEAAIIERGRLYREEHADEIRAAFDIAFPREATRIRQAIGPGEADFGAAPIKVDPDAPLPDMGPYLDQIARDLSEPAE